MKVLRRSKAQKKDSQSLRSQTPSTAQTTRGEEIINLSQEFASDDVVAIESPSATARSIASSPYAELSQITHARPVRSGQEALRQLEAF